jgi:hypothetical protein
MDQSVVDKKSLWHLWFFVVGFGFLLGSDLVLWVILLDFES